MTSLIRWNASPARDLLGLRDDVDRLFETMFQTSPLNQEGARGFLPPADIEETKDGFVVRLDLPGVTQQDVKVSLLGDTLTVRGERTLERKDKTLHRVERQHGTFERTFTLAVPVRPDQVKATFRDGVLEIQIPKAEEAKIREIEVQVGS